MTVKSNVDQGQVASPKSGDTFRCEACGMELEITQDCNCQNGQHASFRCCGQEMTRD